MKQGSNECKKVVDKADLKDHLLARSEALVASTPTKMPQKGRGTEGCSGMQSNASPHLNAAEDNTGRSAQ